MYQEIIIIYHNLKIITTLWEHFNLKIIRKIQIFITKYSEQNTKRCIRLNDIFNKWVIQLYHDGDSPGTYLENRISGGRLVQNEHDGCFWWTRQIWIWNYNTRIPRILFLIQDTCIGLRAAGRNAYLFCVEQRGDDKHVLSCRIGRAKEMKWWQNDVSSCVVHACWWWLLWQQGCRLPVARV